MNDLPQKATGSMAYPQKGTLYRLVYKTPLFLWRTGLGPWLSHPQRGGSRMLALTTRGRKSGQARHTMLSQAHAGGVDYVCSGWGQRSDWVRNIGQDPLVTVQSGREPYSARAYRVEDLEEYTAVVESIFLSGGDSHFEPWLASFGIEFNREDMIAKRDRLQVFGFRPGDEPGPTPLPADLRWVWPIALAVVILVILAVF